MIITICLPLLLCIRQADTPVYILFGGNALMAAKIPM
jgi:hypothetical protein